MPIDIDHAKRLSEARTDGPWTVGNPFDACDGMITVLDKDGYTLVGDCCFGAQSDLDAVAVVAFIAFCGTHFDSLIAELEALRKVAEAADGLEQAWIRTKWTGALKNLSVALKAWRESVGR
jgi:hypothetical protein